MGSIPTSGVHHVTFTVSDLDRSLKFYTEVLGFKLIADLADFKRKLLSNDTLFVAITLPLDESQSPADDTFNENRVGLDHFSFAMPNKAALEDAVKVLDEHGVPHGEIYSLGGAGLPFWALVFRDPDNIQLELFAPE